MSPLKNDLQQKWYMCTTEAETANYFIGYQNLANLQQKTALKRARTPLLRGILVILKKSPESPPKLSVFIRT